MAVELAPFLYKQPLRITGNARWVRTEVGEWEQLSFKAKEFSPLIADDLATAVGKLRNIDADWRRETDPSSLLGKLRGENDEAH
jgi:hypothetical protein